MDILVTDITEMNGGQYCVAGWCAAAKRMIRPMPDHTCWSHALLESHKIVPGDTIRVATVNSATGGSLPHNVEDQVISTGSIKVVSTSTQPWFGTEAPPSSPTISDAFEGHVVNNRVWQQRVQGAHVKIGTNTRSLWAVQVQRDSLRLREDKFGDNEPKLKLALSDGVELYELPISSRTLKEAWRTSGLPGVTGALPSCKTLHVRVGLARAFASQPDKCYIMVNGIYG